MKMHSANGDKLMTVAKMLDALGAAKNTNVPPCSIVMDRTMLEKKSFDVQNYQEIPCCCAGSPRFTQTLVLEDDEINFIKRTPCNQSNSRRPYAQLGAIVARDEEIPGCCGGPAYDCCVCQRIGGNSVEVDGVGIMSPKYGMEKELVTTIAHELQQRKVKLGNIGQLKKGEQTRDVSRPNFSSEAQNRHMQYKACSPP
jgi:hypothetical protein